MKHIKVGVQNDCLFVKSRFMYIVIVIDVLVKKNVSIIDNVMCREVFFFQVFLSVQCKFHPNIGELVLKMFVWMRRSYLCISE